MVCRKANRKSQSCFTCKNGRKSTKLYPFPLSCVRGKDFYTSPASESPDQSVHLKGTA